jgi:endonuclease YncB( thermonuclease family)
MSLQSTNAGVLSTTKHFFPTACCLLAVLSGTLQSAEPAENAPLQTRYAAKVIAVNGPEEIVLERPTGKQTVRMANVLAFEAWPTDKQSAEAKAKFSDFLNKTLLNQNVWVEEYPVDSKANVVFADLSHSAGAGTKDFKWSGQTYSERAGWGVNNINILAVENGHSPLVRMEYLEKNPKYLNQLLIDAAEDAATKKLGIWNDAEVTEKLIKAAGEYSQKYQPVAKSN